MPEPRSSNTTPVYLPHETWVNIHAFTNAAFEQHVIIEPEVGATINFTGSGEHDNPIGQTGLQTPQTSEQPAGFRMSVSVESFADGKWSASAVAQSQLCRGWYYNLIMVVSEDYQDNDWNDAVVLFAWWTPPQQRVVPEAMRS
jgi:hypothetical protein